MVLWSCNTTVEGPLALVEQDTPSRVKVFSKEHKSKQKFFTDIEFGITATDFQKQFPETINRIGAYDYTFTLIYQEGHLCLLKVDSFPKSPDLTENKIVDELENMARVINNKYNKPSASYGYPFFYDYEPGQTQWVYVWILKKKRIKLGIEAVNNSEFQVRCRIYSSDIFKQEEKAT